MATFFNSQHLNQKQLAKGILLKSVYGNNTMLTFFEFSPNAVIPSHKHPHEQITYIVEGELELITAKEKKVLKQGEGIVLLANEEHGARVLDKPAKVIDAWHPVREDYKIS